MRTLLRCRRLGVVGSVIWLVGVFVAGANVPVFARDPGAVTAEAKDAVAYELAECSSFYVVSGASIANASAPTENARYSIEVCDEVCGHRTGGRCATQQPEGGDGARDGDP